MIDGQMRGRIWRGLCLVGVPLLLSACTSSIVPSAERPGPGFTPASPAQRGGLIGLDSRKLIDLFGKPHLDIRDPAVRKLQFTDGRCVLDAYLYPPARRREPVVTHVDARRADTGAAMDWQSCAQLLRQH